MGGVWHTAGVLSDGVLSAQTAAKIAHVFAPKVNGAWNLHCGVVASPLTTFALFSSVTALFGSAGQANYSAANTCLDTLAGDRFAAGLAATSVQWASWEEVGMAARGAASARAAAMEASTGFGRIALKDGLRAMETSLLQQARVS